MRLIRGEIRRPLERVLDAFTENLAYKGLSLGFAVAIWAWVQSNLVVETRTRARVNVVWPKSLVPTADIPDSLLVTVQGPQGLVRTIEHYDPRIQVDLGDAAEGNLAIDFTASAVEGLPEGIKVVHLSPPGVTANLEPRRSKKLEVRPAIEGEPARGWTVKSVRVVPEFVVASGPESVTLAMTNVGTEFVDIAGLKQDLATGVSLTPTGSNVTLSWTAEARVEIDIEPIRVSRTFATVPVTCEECTSEPSSVLIVVEGHQDEVEALLPDSIQAQVAGLAVGEAHAKWSQKDQGSLVVLLPETAPSVTVTTVKPSTVRIAPGD